MATVARSPQSPPIKPRIAYTSAHDVVRADADALRRGFERGATAKMAPQRSGLVESLTERVRRGSVNLFFHVALFANNWIERGADQNDVEQFGHAYLAMVRRKYASGTASCLRELSRAETIAQGPADVVQIDIDQLEGPALIEAEKKVAADYLATGRLLDAIRAELYARDLPPAA